MPHPPVRFHFDFISPYSYLASQLLAREARWATIDFDYRPVVFGTMLSKLQAQGPGEIPARRRLGLQDVLLLAEHHRVPFRGPPTHPFNSIYALRSICALDDPADRRRLTTRYFFAGWAEDVDLSMPEALVQLAREVGIEQDVEAVASQRDIRQALKRNTQTLLDAGGWGVPTFIVEDVLLFGHDRLDVLAKVVDGALAPDRDKLADLLQRPQPGRIT